MFPRDLERALSIGSTAEELGWFHENALLPVECNLHGPQSVNTQVLCKWGKVAGWLRPNQANTELTFGTIYGKTFMICTTQMRHSVFIRSSKSVDSHIVSCIQMVYCMSISNLEMSFHPTERLSCPFGVLWAWV